MTLFGGFTIQWESAEATLNGTNGYPVGINHTFNRPFTNACLAVIPIPENRDHYAVVFSRSTDGCAISTNGGTGGGTETWHVRIISIGY
jgi:hypothetical protein